MESNQLAVEFAACERFGIDPFIQIYRPREERKALAGYHTGRNTLQSMCDHDTKPKPNNKTGKKNGK